MNLGLAAKAKKKSHKQKKRKEIEFLLSYDNEYNNRLK